MVKDYESTVHPAVRREHAREGELSTIPKLIYELVHIVSTSGLKSRKLFQYIGGAPLLTHHPVHTMLRITRNGRYLCRYYSAKPETPSPSEQPKLSPEQARAEAAKLALQSMKDVGSLFSSGSDEATQPIDTKPVFENPKLFGNLSLLHQGQVQKELQQKFDVKWTKLSTQDKKLGYYMAYGNWGARENFDEWDKSAAPLDLPFTVPPKIRTANPSKLDVVNKLEPVILAETPVRKEQFDTSKMDPVTKTFIYLTVFVIILAVARDKNTGEEGRPVEVVVEDKHAIERELQFKKAAEEKEKEEALLQVPPRKWYYLWLK